MKRNIITILLLITGLMMSLNSCVNNGQTIATPSSPPINTNITVAYTPTATNTITPVFITPTNTQTDTVIPTETLTPLPTLSATEQDGYFAGLIQNTSNCKLPCWWGMTPGISSWQDAVNFVNHLGFGKVGSLSDSSIGLGVDISELQLYQELNLYQESNTVSKISFTVEGHYNPSGFQDVWGAYLPKNILAIYGKPSRVTLYISTANAEIPTNKLGEGYLLWLFYDEKGVLIRYSGVSPVQSGKIHICPQISADRAQSITEIRFYLQNPASSTPIEKMIDGYEGFKPDTLSLEAATGLSIDQLMDLSQGGVICFDTPLSLWP